MCILLTIGELWLVACIAGVLGFGIGHLITKVNRR